MVLQRINLNEVVHNFLSPFSNRRLFCEIGSKTRAPDYMVIEWKMESNLECTILSRWYFNNCQTRPIVERSKGHLKGKFSTWNNEFLALRSTYISTNVVRVLYSKAVSERSFKHSRCRVFTVLTRSISTVRFISFLTMVSWKCKAAWPASAQFSWHNYFLMGKLYFKRCTEMKKKHSL